MDFGFISTPFFCIFWDLSASLVLVIFDNTSIRKRVSCKSRGVKFSTFSTCFVDFVSSSIFIRFCYVFEAIWGSIWHHFSEKNLSEIRLKKREPLCENSTSWTDQNFIDDKTYLLILPLRNLFLSGFLTFVRQYLCNRSRFSFICCFTVIL